MARQPTPPRLQPRRRCRHSCRKERHGHVADRYIRWLIPGVGAVCLHRQRQPALRASDAPADGQGGGTNLSIVATCAGPDAVLRRCREVPRPDTGSCRADPAGHRGHVLVARPDLTTLARLEEVERHGRWTLAEGALVSERVDPQLEVLVGKPLRLVAPLLE